MAEQTIGERVRAAMSRLNPVTRIGNNLREGFSEFRDHPIQETIQRLGGFLAGGATANPLVGAATGRGLDSFFNWWNGLGGDQGPAGGMPGITSPYQGQQSQSPMSDSLGIPNYAGGNPGFTAPSSGIPMQNWGSQSQPGQQGAPWLAPDAILVDGQAPAPNTNGLPGITSPNTYTQPQTVGNTPGSGNTVQGSAAMATLGQLLSDARGNMGQSTIRPMQQEFGTTLMGANGQTRERGSDMRGMERGPLPGSATAAEFIRNNPMQWAQMQQIMRSRN